jgi:diguanylate cyclase (GGDEF)-like protein
MNPRQSAWSYRCLLGGTLACVGFVVVDPPGESQPWWYLLVAAFGTGMAVVGVWKRPRSTRRVWIAIAVGQVLYLLGDALFYLYQSLLHLAPYPSPADAAYLARYPALLLGLCWLVRGRQPGRDHAAFLDAAIVSSALALLATVFLIIPAARGDVSLLSRVVAASYPVGDLLILAVLVQLIATRAMRNVSFLALAGGLGVLLGVDVVYTEVVSTGRAMPPWTNIAYLAPYLLIGFAAMHPSSRQLIEAPPRAPHRSPVGRAVTLGIASLLGPTLLARSSLLHSTTDTLSVAIGTAVISLLVLSRVLDLLRVGETQSNQLAVLARTDGLTGVANRRTWDFELTRAATAALGDGTNLTVGLIDLDHFKRYNDEHGHLAGDRVLRETAANWTACLDGRGFIARYGGEEFALLLPHMAPDQAEPLLDQLRQCVTREQTCSIGVTGWRHDELPQLATARADRALYQAKEAGRNQSAVFLDEAPSTSAPRRPPVAIAI